MFANNQFVLYVLPGKGFIIQNIIYAIYLPKNVTCVVEILIFTE